MKNQYCISCESEQFKRDGNCTREMASDGLVAKCAGPWAEIKQKIIDAYSKMITVGMRNKFDQIIYVDLYSGPGIFYNRETGLESFGSALTALQHNYHRVFLNDLNLENVKALRQRVGERQSKVTLKNLDANRVAAIFNSEISNRSLTFCFIDPDNFGNLNFDTIRDICSEKNCFDLLVNFPYVDYKRSVHLSKDRFDNFFGTKEWRDIERKYSGKGLGSRAGALIDLYMRQLAKLKFLMPNIRNAFPIQNTNDGIIYYLVYASKNAKGYDFCKEMGKYAISQQGLEI